MPVESKTVISATDLRPGLRPTMTSPISPAMSRSVKSPVAKGTLISPSVRHWRMSSTKMRARLRIRGSSSWSPRIFVDDIHQCRTDGEINVPLATGLLTERDIAGEIGEVIVGRKPGRRSVAEITVFDSTGIALQDAATRSEEHTSELQSPCNLVCR